MSAVEIRIIAHRRRSEGPESAPRGKSGLQLRVISGLASPFHSKFHVSP